MPASEQAIGTPEVKNILNRRHTVTGAKKLVNVPSSGKALKGAGS